MRRIDALIAAGMMISAAFFYSPSCLAEHAPESIGQIREVEDADRIFTVSIENDSFNGTDDNYTNGIRFALLSAENNVPDWMTALASHAPFFDRDGHKRWEVAFGQNIYTPSDITIKTLQVNDRPYAGWLYGSAGIYSDSGFEQDFLGLTLGIVGPLSGAAQAQDFVHDLIGSPDPQGWSHQLKNEPGVVLTYEHKWRALYAFSPRGFGGDFTPSIGISAGNIFTHASMGGVFRFGYDLPADYGPPIINPNLPGSDYFVGNQDFGWYLFAGFEGRAVARNIFLDGNSFAKSHSIDKYPLVGGLQGGLAVTIQHTRIAYTQIIRSKEFEGQKKNDVYGALTLSYRF